MKGFLFLNIYFTILIGGTVFSTGLILEDSKCLGYTFVEDQEGPMQWSSYVTNDSISFRSQVNRASKPFREHRRHYLHVFVQIALFSIGREECDYICIPTHQFTKMPFQKDFFLTLLSVIKSFDLQNEVCYNHIATEILKL